MLIGLVRHGRTDWNALGKIQGQTDIPLNAEGVKQAEALASRLVSEEPIWDGVLSSDLIRARETARIIANKLRAPLLGSDTRFREKSFGEVEGTTEGERIKRWGKEWRSAAKGVELDSDVRARGLEAIDEWRAKHPKKNLLIVSHGAFLANILSELCSDLEDQRLNNLSYSILEYNDGVWLPKLYNCTLHLK